MSEKVAVIGLGYVGLPLALTCYSAGFNVIGIDKDEKKINMLKSGKSYINHISDKDINKNLITTSSFSLLQDCDNIFVCVPTPMNDRDEPDHSLVLSAFHQIKKHLRKGQLIILESTVSPGFTEEQILPLLKSTGLNCPNDFCLAFSPEREDPGNKTYNIKNIPKLVGGVNKESTIKACLLYSKITDRVLPVSSAKIAETAKLFENIFRIVNIGFVNEMKLLCDEINVDIWEVIQAAKTKPFGFMPFYPGFGVGGHCLTNNPAFLLDNIKDNATIINAAINVNNKMPNYIIDKLLLSLNKQKKCINGSNILVCGISYKENINDDRGSPSYIIIDKLIKLGANVSYCDPYFETIQYKIEKVNVDKVKFSSFDAVIICTAHKEFIDKTLFNKCQLVIDTKNITDNSIKA